MALVQGGAWRWSVRTNAEVAMIAAPADGCEARVTTSALASFWRIGRWQHADSDSNLAGYGSSAGDCNHGVCIDQLRRGAHDNRQRGVVGTVWLDVGATVVERSTGVLSHMLCAS
jgi:hypothetical protein